MLVLAASSCGSIWIPQTGHLRDTLLKLLAPLQSHSVHIDIGAYLTQRKGLAQGFAILFAMFQVV